MENIEKYFKALLVSKQVDQDSEREIFVGLDISWQLSAKNVKELGRLILLGHQGLKIRIDFSDEQIPTMTNIIVFENPTFDLLVMIQSH